MMVTLNGSGKAVLAVFMGFFSEIDFGGPVTKAVSMFTLSMINEGIMEPNGIFRILVAVPPIGIFLSTIIAKKKYSEEERDNAKAVGIMGCLGITEGAIPYAIKDPKAVYRKYRRGIDRGLWKCGMPGTAWRIHCTSGRRKSTLVCCCNTCRLCHHSTAAEGIEKGCS